MPDGLSETAAANGLSNDLRVIKSSKISGPKRPAYRTAAAVAEAQQRAAMAEQQLDDLRAFLAEPRDERDAWRQQAQRLALRETQPTQRPGWWLWGKGG